MNSISPNLNIMIKASEKASKSLIRDFGEVEKLQISKKGPSDFVTNADLKAEKTIIEELKKARPNYSILSEETGSELNNDKNYTWIIDPIDGTSNFLHGIPHFGISIALKYNSEIISGMVFDPIKNEMFFAEKGSGAFLNNSRIRVSNKKSLKESMLVTGGPRVSSKKREDIFKEYTKISNIVDIPIRKFGSAALDIANVACGRFDGYWQWELSYWDIAAGIIILKEAGGYIEFLDVNEKNSLKRNIIASNSKIHQELKDAIKKNIE